MPYLAIKTNVDIDAGTASAISVDLTAATAGLLGKPERYVMVSLESSVPMAFAASTEPLAYVELKSIGLPEDQTAGFSAALCDAIGDQLQIPAERIYIEFANAERHMFGWNGGTF